MHSFCAWWASTGQQSLIGVLVQILRLRMMTPLIDNDDIDDDDNDGHFADDASFFFMQMGAEATDIHCTACCIDGAVIFFAWKEFAIFGNYLLTNQPKSPGKQNIMQTYILDTY